MSDGSQINTGGNDLGILAVGFFSALIAYFFKPIGILIGLIGLLPFAYALLAGPIQVTIDPSSVQQVTSGVVTATANFITADLLNYPGAALFGAIVGLFSPGSV
jgi:hypothetical protein